MAQCRIAAVNLWFEGLENWTTIVGSMEIPPGAEIHLLLHWLNQSEEAVTGHVDVTVASPNGEEQSLSAVANQDQELEPGGGVYVQFEPFVPAGAGAYTVTATLTSGDEELDSVTYNLVAPGGVIDGGMPILPASMMMPVMMIMMVALMAALVKPLAGQSSQR